MIEICPSKGEGQIAGTAVKDLLVGGRVKRGKACVHQRALCDEYSHEARFSNREITFRALDHSHDRFTPFLEKKIMKFMKFISGFEKRAS